ncbi:hypothetical protein HD806DRAFT_490501 [Xylariaceae sp. AK1471]|nr:hypothetical protein HD806DRAFT_490501 [Xylariaceae sp. AK1471]
MIIGQSCPEQFNTRCNKDVDSRGNIFLVGLSFVSPLSTKVCHQAHCILTMLTTIPLATSCLTNTWLTSDGGTGGQHISLGVPHDTNCWPGGRDLSTTISPAICPFGYTSACDIVGASRRDESETVWACCPSQFHCDTGKLSCVMDSTHGMYKTYIVTDFNALGSTITRQFVHDGGIDAHSIRVAFHSSDILNPFSTTIAATLPPNATLSPTLTSSLPIPTSAATSPTSSAGNGPRAAWIGAGIGIGSGAILLVSSIACSSTFFGVWYMLCS